MKFALKYSKELIDLYENKKLSATAVAKELNTYPNMVIRSLRYLGVEIRDKSESQKLFLEKNEHPKKGVKISDDAKKKIGQKHLERWKDMDEETRKKISEDKRKEWYNKSDEELDEMRKRAHKAIRKASEEGSKLERDIASGLRDAGYQCFIHDKYTLMNEKMEIDIMIQSEGVAIEVDGVSHFESVWGEERLAKQKDSDNRKNGLITMGGYCLIRVKNAKDKYGKIEIELMIQKIIDIIEQVKVKFPDIHNRIFEVEV